LHFTTHEFIKISKVGTLITNAIQTVMDKINSKDKITQANKVMVRALDSKLKSMETNINLVTRMTK